MVPFFKNRFQEVLFLGITTLAFIAFYIETDIYTPSFPQMVSYFGTNEDAIQMLLSMNFLGLCLSCLFFGPASDAYGRKKILCSGLFIFMFGSLGCSLTDSLQWMIGFRFLQGVGCGAIVSAGIATIFDVFPAEKSSRLVAVLNGAVGGMMAVAPLLGNWVGLHFGWRSNFYLIAALAVAVYFSTLLFTKETLAVEKRAKLDLISVFKNYGAILANIPFMAHSLIWCLMFSVVIIFIANLSLIYIDHLHVAKELFGYYQTAIMGAFFAGSMLSAYLIKKWGMMKTKIFGNVLYLAGIFFLVGLTWVDSRSPEFLIVSMALSGFGSAVAMTIYFSFSITYLPVSLRGAAMSLTQCLRLFLTSGLVWIAAHAFDGSMKPISLLSITCVAICVAFYFFLYKKNQHGEQVAQ